MKAVIPEGLASIYDITVPHSLDMRKVRKQLDAEIEKLHPRFPERCAVDYRIRLQPYGESSSGLHVRAVVMDRFLLADIRKQNVRRMLYLSGPHPYPVFSGRILARRCALAAALFLAAVLSFFLVRFFISGSLTPFQKAAAEPADTEEVLSAFQADAAFPGEPAYLAGAASEEPGFMQETAASSFENPDFVQQDFSALFKSVHEQGGRLSSFVWRADEGVLSFRTQGLYPEQIEAAAEAYGAVSFGPVSYRGAEPELECTVEAAAALAVQAQPGGGAVPHMITRLELLRDAGRISVALQLTDELDAGIAAFRKLVLDNGGSLISETVSPPALSGNIPETEWMQFAPGLLVRGLETLFDDVSEQIEKSQSASDMQDEIGRITREDGSYVVFYHNKEGKIEQKTCED